MFELLCQFITMRLKSELNVSVSCLTCCERCVEINAIKLLTLLSRLMAWKLHFTNVGIVGRRQKWKPREVRLIFCVDLWGFLKTFRHDSLQCILHHVVFGAEIIFCLNGRL